MRASRHDADAPQSPDNDVDNSETRQANKRCATSEEDLSIGNRGSCLGEVRRDRLSHVGRHWQTPFASHLPVDDYLASAPIDVVELEGCDFAEAKAEPKHQSDDRGITTSDRRGDIVQLEQLLELRRLKGSREP